MPIDFDAGGDYRIWQCSCGGCDHYVKLSWHKWRDGQIEGFMTLEANPHAYGLWGRLKNAWKGFRNKPHTYGIEVLVNMRMALEISDSFYELAYLISEGEIKAAGEVVAPEIIAADELVDSALSACRERGSIEDVRALNIALGQRRKVRAELKG